MDAAGRIVVADGDNHRVLVFDPLPPRDADAAAAAAAAAGDDDEGPGCAGPAVARVLGSEGAGVGELRNPMGVAVDRAGRIVVADYENHRVQVRRGRRMRRPQIPPPSLRSAPRPRIYSLPPSLPPSLSVIPLPV